MNQKQIKNMIKSGAAADITNLSFDDCENLSRTECGFEKIVVSHGINGMNGCLLRGRKSGSVYGITCRNSNLFYFV